MVPLSSPPPPFNLFPNSHPGPEEAILACEDLNYLAKDFNVEHLAKLLWCKGELALEVWDYLVPVKCREEQREREREK